MGHLVKPDGTILTEQNQDVRALINEVDTCFELIRIHGSDTPLSPQAVQAINEAWPKVKAYLDGKEPEGLLTNDRRLDMLTGALEGGSNYWYDLREASEEAIKTVVPELDTLRKQTPFVDLMWQAIEGGASIPVFDIEDEEGEAIGHISLESIAKGEALMLANENEHFSDIIGEYDDATTADVWFQFCVLGELVYG